MKSLILLSITIGTFSVQEIPKITVMNNPVKRDIKSVLVKPQKEYDPLVWVAMIEGVKQFEGYKANPYYCPGGVRTIGYGHTEKAKKYKYISKKQAHELLVQDLKKARNLVDKYVNVPLTHGQIAALTSFTFNCGEGNLKKLVSGKGRLNDGNYKSVSKVLPMYSKAKGKTLKGLEKRRNWELELWNDKSEYLVKN